MVIDASRRNPYERRFRSYSHGLAPIAAPDNALILTSATPGKVADDSKGQNSVLVSELLEQFQHQGRPRERLQQDPHLDLPCLRWRAGADGELDAGRGSQPRRLIRLMRRDISLSSVVMPGLVPGIHVFAVREGRIVDGRVKPGHDGFVVRFAPTVTSPPCGRGRIASPDAIRVEAARPSRCT